MTIRKGEPWGEPAEVPADGLESPDSDRGASRSLELQREAGRPLGPIGVQRGDMARTLGGGTPGRFDGTLVKAPVDLLQVRADDREHLALAHVVVRRSWWRGEVVLAMNAQYLGAYDVAPRSHPNDGRVDVLRVDPAMPLRARHQARSRARSGTHLPHPQLEMRSTGEWHHRFDRPMPLWIDGVRCGDVRDLTVTVLPDALTLYA
ncbi:MAG: hypothetical protein RL238_2968 [Actinomycetota bacterium]